MLYRLIIVLGCIVLFINSCNSLISGVTGTHKLRTFSVEQAEREGLGDSDFVEITGAWRTGDFLYAPPLKGEKAGAVQYPVLSAERLAQLDANQKPRTAIIAWTQAYDPACVERGDCAPKGAITIKGVVRKIPKPKNKVSEFATRYDVAENAIYIETDRAPLAWYWHLGFMVGAVAVGVITELIYNRRKGKSATA